ncbi:MAG: hypothetical protein ACI4NL_06640 [Christensenellales bacterium]
MKLNTDGKIKALLLFFDAMIWAGLILYAERRIIMLCYTAPAIANILGLLSMAGVYALFRTASLMTKAKKKEESGRPKLMVVLLSSLAVGVLAGIAVNALAQVKPGISVPAAIAAVSLLTSLLMICAFYIGVLAGGRDKHNA